MESKLKGEVAVINRILTSMLMFLAMAMPAVLLLLLQFSSTLVRADQQTDWYLQQLFEPGGAQLQQQAGGRVQIYSGLTDTGVSRARVENDGS
jgi:hypothetical protein